MNLRTLLELAAFAAADNTLIENHKLQGIHTALQAEFNELCILLDYARAEGHTEETIDAIRADIAKIQEAIKVYWGI